MFGIEGRYAHAAYSAAAKKKSVDKVETELNEFQVLFLLLSTNAPSICVLAVENDVWARSADSFYDGPHPEQATKNW